MTPSEQMISLFAAWGFDVSFSETKNCWIVAKYSDVLGRFEPTPAGMNQMGDCITRSKIAEQFTMAAFN